MNTTIEYYSENVYGIAKKYVKDDKARFIISSLTNRKTLTEADIVALQELGFTFKEVLKG